MKVVALDPGYAATGLVVFDYARGAWYAAHAETVRLPPPSAQRKATERASVLDAERIRSMARRLADLVNDHGASGMVAELPGAGGQSYMAVRAMALATGMMVTLAELLGIPTEYYDPFEVKRAATGKTTATKDEVIAKMRAKHPALATLTRKADLEHAADAAGAFEAARAGSLLRILAAGSRTS